MSRPPLEVADLIRAAGAAFIERSRKWISWKHSKVLLAIARCRTAALGGHLDQCTRCGHRGAEIGFFSVLHTWNQKLQLHPHVHCVVPAGGLSTDHTHWVPSRDRFFLPIHVLGRVFRGKFVAGLRQVFQEGRLNFHGNLACLAQPKIFAAWLRPLFRKDWVVYSKPPFGGPEYV